LDPLQHLIKITHQFLIAKVDDKIALRFQPCGAAGIAGQFLRRLMRYTINLNHELCFTAAEVREEGTD
jgi:hypothetical protein